MRACYVVVDTHIIKKMHVYSVPGGCTCCFDVNTVVLM